MCSVMAWANPTPITTLEGFESAIATGGDYELNDDIDASGTEAQVSAAVTINLNGHTLTTPATCASEYQGECIQYGDDGGLGIIYGATLTLTGSGALYGCLKIIDDDFLYDNGGPAVITFNNQFTGTFDGTINDGSFGMAHISIRGGTFTFFDPSDTDWLEDDCYVTENEDDWTYTVHENVVAPVVVARVEVVGGEQYSSLQDAFAAAPNGSTVRLLENIELDYSGIVAEYPLSNVDGIIKVTNDITLNLNSHNITFKTQNKFHDNISAINIFNGGKLTIIGDGKVLVGYDHVPLIQSFTEESSYSGVFGIETDEDHNPLGQLVLRGGTYQWHPSEELNYFRYGASLEDEVEIEETQEGYYKLTYNDAAPAGQLRAYLTGESSATYTVTEDINLISSGVINISGTKTLYINEGVTVAFKNNAPAIVVPNGATLNLKGKGSLSFLLNIIKVEKGGTLVIGDANSTDALTITSSFPTASSLVNVSVYYAIDNYGTTNIYRANITSRKNTIQNHATGKMIIKNARIIGQASTSDVGTNSHAYAVINSGTMVLADTYVQGYHGAVACHNDNGTLELRNCDLRALNAPAETDAYYALYVCTKAMVSAYDTKFYSENESYTIYIGDNDSQNSFGLIYLYDGCKTNRKLYVQQKSGQDDDILFPVLVSSESAWYTAALNGGEGPLPANCVYQEIPSGSDDYNAGYRYKVVNNATDQKVASDDPIATIPWQLEKTWDPTASATSKENVPVSNTIVTIPAGKEVIVKKDEDLNPDAVAGQIFIGDGAKLTVEAGTTLTVGEGGVNIADGGQLIVENKAIVKVGEAGIVTANENAIVIKSNADGTGAFLIHPDVKENTHPAATVQMYAKAHKVGGNWFPQHCGIPTVGAPESITFPTGGDTYMDKFVADGANPWEAVTSISALEPFVGYRLNFSGANAAGVYTFKGNLQGNGDAPLQFVKPYYNLLANSYTSPMDIAALFNGLSDQYENGVDLTLWVYNSTNNHHEVVSKLDIEEHTAGFTTIAPMQGYILYCGPTQAAAGSIDYKSTIWNCAEKIGVPILAPARNVNDGRVRATIVVSSATSSDKVVLRETDNYSNAFENGADARKYMSENVFNIYSTNDGEAFSQIATDNLMGIAITVKAANETAYTLSFSNVQNFNYAIRDNLSGAIIPVEEGMTYEFTMNEGATAEGRFEVVERYNTPTGVENIEAARSAKGIYTILGQYIGESSLLNTLPTGIYVVDGQRIVK